MKKVAQKYSGGSGGLWEDPGELSGIGAWSWDRNPKIYADQMAALCSYQGCRDILQVFAQIEINVEAIPALNYITPTLLFLLFSHDKATQ